MGRVFATDLIVERCALVRWGKDMNNRKHIYVLSIFVMLAVASCAHQPDPSAYDPPGFFTGIWHGFIIVFSFIGSIFTDIRIYAFPNSGFWYDFGYLIGLFLWLVALASQ